MRIKKSVKETFCEKIKIRSKSEKLELDEMILAARFLHSINNALDEKHMLLKEFAQQMDVSASYITQIFRGNKIPNLKFLAKAQDVLNIKFEISTSTSFENPITHRKLTKTIPAKDDERIPSSSH